MIHYWDVDTDDIDERPTGSSAVTEIVVHVPQVGQETPNQWISRAKAEIRVYRDPSGYHCDFMGAHPENAKLIARGIRPLFQSTYRIVEDKKSLGFFHVTINWLNDTEIKGMAFERVPPRVIQHQITSNIRRSPNTGRWFTTSAGELIKGIQRERRFGGLNYSMVLPSLPAWFDDAQAGCVNSVGVRLNGKFRPAYTVWCESATATPEKTDNMGWMQRVDLTLLFNPDTWLEPYLDAGYYELIFVAYTIPKKKGEKGQPVDLTDFNIPKIFDQLWAHAKSGRPYALTPRLQVKIERRYVPIKTWLYKDVRSQKPAQEIVDVDEPAALHRSGAALRRDEPGYPLATSDIPPGQLNILRLDLDPQVDMNLWNLW